MRKVLRHNLFNGLLVVAVMFAPLQVAVSAIDMLEHGNTQMQHCQMEMSDHADKGSPEKPDCCQNGFNCAKCISVHAMLPDSVISNILSPDSYEQIDKSLAHGVMSQSQFRPPRSFS